MTRLADLDAKVDAATDRWLDLICTGTAADAAAAAKAVRRAEDALRAERRRLQAERTPTAHTGQR